MYAGSGDAYGAVCILGHNKNLRLYAAKEIRRWGICGTIPRSSTLADSAGISGALTNATTRPSHLPYSRTSYVRCLLMEPWSSFWSVMCYTMQHAIHDTQCAVHTIHSTQYTVHTDENWMNIGRRFDKNGTSTWRKLDKKHGSWYESKRKGKTKKTAKASLKDLIKVTGFYSVL